MSLAQGLTVRWSRITVRIYEHSKLSTGAFFNNEMSLRAEATSSSLTLISSWALGPGDRTEPHVPLQRYSIPSGGIFHHALIVSVPASIIIAKQNYDIFLDPSDSSVNTTNTFYSLCSALKCIFPKSQTI